MKLKSPNTVSEVKHYETELFFKISLFIQFIPSWKQREFDDFDVFLRHKKNSEALTLLIKSHCYP